jgi:hypothetical protein
MIYATLASWGMHRMGGGAVMNDYKKFKNSIIDVINDINEIYKKENEIIDNENAQIFENIFNTIQPMHSSVKIVGNSKVLAHYFPNMICPMDREYTMQFINGLGDKSIPKPNFEFSLFVLFHNEIVFKLIKNREFAECAKEWINSGKYEWDTSIPKVIDNLIIGKITRFKD